MILGESAPVAIMAIMVIASVMSAMQDSTLSLCSTLQIRYTSRLLSSDLHVPKDEVRLRVPSSPAEPILKAI